MTRPALVLLLGSLVAACGGGDGPAATGFPDELVVDCVGRWEAGKVALRFNGNHPDYQPDDAYAQVGKDDLRPFRYYADAKAKQMRLWLDHGKTIDSVPFKVETVKDDRYVTEYALVFGKAVYGQKRFTGTLTKSFKCEPRR